MKKTVKHVDGTEEIIEGTAEELAEYEKNLQESGGKKKKNPKLLTDDVKKLADFLDDPKVQSELTKTLDEMKRVREDLANRPICAPFHVHISFHSCPICQQHFHPYYKPYYIEPWHPNWIGDWPGSVQITKITGTGTDTSVTSGGIVANPGTTTTFTDFNEGDITCVKTWDHALSLAELRQETGMSHNSGVRGIHGS